MHKGRWAMSGIIFPTTFTQQVRGRRTRVSIIRAARIHAENTQPAAQVEAAAAAGEVPSQLQTFYERLAGFIALRTTKAQVDAVKVCAAWLT